jgi:hypothetical protein
MHAVTVDGGKLQQKFKIKFKIKNGHHINEGVKTGFLHMYYLVLAIVK